MTMLRSTHKAIRCCITIRQWDRIREARLHIPSQDSWICFACPGTVANRGETVAGTRNRAALGVKICRVFWNRAAAGDSSIVIPCAIFIWRTRDSARCQMLAMLAA
jgi:hypothetical protein